MLSVRCSGDGDIWKEKTHFQSSNFIETREIIKHSSVRVFIFFPSRHEHTSHQWREKSNEIVISTNVDDQRMCPFFFPFLIFFWTLLSTIISFPVFLPSICHLWRWRNDTKTSNHILYVITFHLIISSSIFFFGLQKEKRFLFVFSSVDTANWQTHKLSWYQSCRSEVFVVFPIRSCPKTKGIFLLWI